MNIWLITAIGLGICLFPCLMRALTGDALNRLVGLETGALIETQILLVLSVVFQRSSFYDLSLALALLALAGGLVFVHFFERWL